MQSSVPDGAELKRIGDHAILAPVEVTISGKDDHPSVRLTFDVIDGRLECREVAVIAEPGDHEVNRAHLRGIGIDAIRDEVMAAWSVPYETTHDGRQMSLRAAGGDDRRRATRAMDSARRRLTDEDLARVADVYANDETGAPTRAVAEAFGVAHRTGTLYVQRARKAGLLPPLTRKA